MGFGKHTILFVDICIMAVYGFETGFDKPIRCVEF